MKRWAAVWLSILLMGCFGARAEEETRYTVTLPVDDASQAWTCALATQDVVTLVSSDFAENAAGAVEYRFVFAPASAGETDATFTRGDGESALYRLRVDDAGRVSGYRVIDVPFASVKANDIDLPCEVALDWWNGTAYTRGSPLENLLSGGASLPYVKLGATVRLTLSGVAPEQCTLYDTILNEDGTPRYTLQNEKGVSVTLEDGALNFTLNPNTLAMLSSDSEDYAPGAVLRGFRLVCSWGENACEYAFALRTDAMTNDADIVDEAVAFLRENARIDELASELGGEATVAHAYLIDLPDDRSALDELLAEEYGKYERVVAVQFELPARLAPFRSYHLVAAGRLGDGSFEMCISPDNLFARTYDANLFALADVRKVK